MKWGTQKKHSIHIYLKSINSIKAPDLQNQESETYARNR